jgi:hypothetical protein
MPFSWLMVGSILAEKDERWLIATYVRSHPGYPQCMIVAFLPLGWSLTPPDVLLPALVCLFD